MTEQLEKKIKDSIRIIQMFSKDKGVIEIAYSGGKDSDVILQLAKEAGIKYRAIYKNTTIDPPRTIAHAKEMGAEIIQPKKSFFDLIKEKGYPNRAKRFCCAELKEYKVLDTVIIGVRKAESKKRAERYEEPTQCRVYSKKKDICAHQIFPILEWTDDDVAEFIADRGIKCHPLYYDEQGNFHAERRLGCQGCPLVSQKKRVEFFKENPKWLKAWLKAGHEYYKNRTMDEYEMMVSYLFYRSFKEFSKTNGLFGKMDCKEVLERRFNIKL